MKLEKLYDKYRKLKPFKDYTKPQLLEFCRKKLREYDPALNVAEMFIDKNEQKLAKELLLKYLDDFVIENISDKSTLKQIIYLEIFGIRYRNQIEKLCNDKEVNAVPTNGLDELRKIQDQILKLKNTLNIEHTEESSDFYKYSERLKRKFAAYKKENSLSFTGQCPHCSKYFRANRRLKDLELTKHPYFKDRYLYNQHLFELFDKGTITAEDVAKVLETSTDYVEKMYDKIYKKSDIQ